MPLTNLVFLSNLATISVSKVTAFKPSGANFIDEESVINNENVMLKIYLVEKYQIIS